MKRYRSKQQMPRAHGNNKLVPFCVFFFFRSVPGESHEICSLYQYVSLSIKEFKKEVDCAVGGVKGSEAAVTRLQRLQQMA